MRRSIDYIANRAFMVVSGALVVFSFLLFFWLAGTLEWRGNDGDLSVSITLRCKHADVHSFTGEVLVNLDEGEINFAIWSTKNESIIGECEKTQIHSLPRPDAIISLAYSDFPVNNMNINADFTSFKNTAGKILWYETEIETQDRTSLKFNPDKLQQFVGLSERSLSFNVHISADSEYIPHDEFPYDLTIRPPKGFHLTSSRPPGTMIDATDWKMDSKAYKIEADFKNDRLARVDHIIDSSIAAVLGVGVAGVMSAWLALRILETKGPDM